MYRSGAILFHTSMKDKRSFEKFYNTHFDKVYRFVFFRIGTNQQLAEDLVSEIFMKALEHFDSYDATRSVSAWLMTIAKNHLANYWRDTKPTIGLPEDEQTEETKADDRIWLKLATHKLKQQAVATLVRQLLALLDPDTAEIVTLHYVVGYTYKEIAAMKDMQEGAVKVAAHRALKKLREQL